MSIFMTIPFILAFALLGCDDSSDQSLKASQNDPAKKTLYYFTWSDYGDPHILKGFEEKTGARVIVDTYSSNEELLAKIQGGVRGYDVVAPSDFMAGVMIHLGLLETLDLTQIPHASLLEKHLEGLPFDPHHHYAIPYLWGTVGIGYDATVIPSPPVSWNALWDNHYRGRISMLNDQREVFGVALRSMGYSLNTRDPQAIQQARDKLIRQKPLVKTYTSEHFDQLLVSGEVVLAHGWGGAIARAMREHPSIRYVVPQEGGTVWTDCLAVLKTSDNKLLAMAFINYLLETDVAVATSNRLLFASANRLVKARVQPAVRNNPAIYPPPSILSRMEWMKDVGPAIRVYDRAWTELKVR